MTKFKKKQKKHSTWIWKKVQDKCKNTGKRESGFLSYPTSSTRSCFWNDYIQEKIKHLRNLLTNNHLSFYKFMKLKKIMGNWIEIMPEKLILIIYPFLNLSARLTNKCRFTLKQSYSLIIKKMTRKVKFFTLHFHYFYIIKIFVIF